MYPDSREGDPNGPRRRTPSTAGSYHLRRVPLRTPSTAGTMGGGAPHVTPMYGSLPGEMFAPGKLKGAQGFFSPGGLGDAEAALGRARSRGVPEDAMEMFIVASSGQTGRNAFRCDLDGRVFPSMETLRAHFRKLYQGAAASWWENHRAAGRSQVGYSPAAIRA